MSERLDVEGLELFEEVPKTTSTRFLIRGSVLNEIENEDSDFEGNAIYLVEPGSITLLENEEDYEEVETE